MIEQILAAAGNVNEGTLAELKRLEKSFASYAEKYDMKATTDPEGTLTVQFTHNDAPIAAYTFFHAE